MTEEETSCEANTAVQAGARSALNFAGTDAGGEKWAGFGIYFEDEIDRIRRSTGAGGTERKTI